MKPIIIVQNGKLVSESKLFAESLSSEYHVPEDRETRIYDFYTLSLYDSLLKHKGTVQAGLLKPGWDEDTVADLQAYVHDGMEIITQELKRDLLDATTLSISSELRHAFDQEENHESVFGSVGKLKDKLQKFYLNLIQQKAMYKTIRKAPSWAKKEMKWREKGQTSGYTIAKNAFDKSGLTYEELSEIGAKVFLLNIWPHAYGGVPWKNICLALARLDKAKSMNEITGAIDHILDLEHNTGVMLNKVKRFSKNGGFEWIKKALDFKFKARPWELAQRSSVPIAVVGRLNRLTGADTDLERFQSLGRYSIPDKDSAVYENTIEFAKLIWNVIAKKFIPYDKSIGTDPKERSMLISQDGKVFTNDPQHKYESHEEYVRKMFPPEVIGLRFQGAYNRMENTHNIVEIGYTERTKGNFQFLILAPDRSALNESVLGVIEQYIKDKDATSISVAVPLIIKEEGKGFKSSEEAIEFIKSSIQKKDGGREKSIDLSGDQSQADGYNRFYIITAEDTGSTQVTPCSSSPEMAEKLFARSKSLCTASLRVVSGSQSSYAVVRIAKEDVPVKSKKIFKTICYTIDPEVLSSNGFTVSLYVQPKKSLSTKGINIDDKNQALLLFKTGQAAVIRSMEKFYGIQDEKVVHYSTPKIVSSEEVLNIVPGFTKFTDWSSDEEYANTLYVSVGNELEAIVNEVVIFMRSGDFPLSGKGAVAIKRVADLLSEMPWKNQIGSLQILLKKVDSDGSTVFTKHRLVANKDIKDTILLTTLIKDSFGK